MPGFIAVCGGKIYLVWDWLEGDGTAPLAGLGLSKSPLAISCILMSEMRLLLMLPFGASAVPPFERRPLEGLLGRAGLLPGLVI